MTFRNLWIFPFIFISCLILFYPSLNYYFFQDDWFVLNWIRKEGVFSFFNFRTDIIYWRPLTMPVFFAISRQLFDLNPFGFHIIAFTFHFVNSFLVYLLMLQLNLNKTSSKFAAFVYVTAAFHFIGLSWLSTTSYIVVTTFILSSIISFLRERFKIFFLFFLLALASSELSIIIIPLIIICKGFSKKTLLYLSPAVFILAAYLVVRFLIFPIPSSGQYTISINRQILVNFLWYFLWTFNIPEKFSTIFFISNIDKFPSLLPQLFKYLIFPIVLIINLFLLTLISNLNPGKIIFGITWFIVSLSPIMIIPRHVYPLYLTIAAIGIIYIFSSSVEKIKKLKPYLMITLSLIWFVSSFATLDFTRKNHWIPNEQTISKTYTKVIYEKIQYPFDNSIFLIKPADVSFSQKHNFTLIETEDNVKQALNDQDAVQVIYNNSSLNSIFTSHQKPVNLPESTHVYEISPRLEK